MPQQEELITLRLLHIVFGAMWVGASVFVAAVAEPALRAAGPGAAGPFIERMGRGIGHLLVGSGAVTIVAGVALALRMRQGSLDTWFDTGWGTAMLIGFIVSLLALGASLAVGRSARSLAGGAGAQGESSEDPAPHLSRLKAAARWSAVLTVVGVGTMAAARFV